MGLLFRLLFLYLPLALIVGAGFALVYGIDDRPAVATEARLSLEDVARGRLLADRYRLSDMPAGKDTPITMTAEELDAVLDATMAASDRVRARAVLRPYGLVVAATVTLPARLGPLGRYVNLRVALPPSSEGFEVSRLAVGRIEVPGALVKPAVGLALDLLAGTGSGRQMVDSVRSVSFSGDKVTVLYRPPGQVVDRLREAAIDAAAIGNAEKVALYYDAIGARARVLAGRGSVSLADFVGTVFKLAKTRSVTHDPADENRAALLALAIRFGDSRFARLVGHKAVDAVHADPPRDAHVRLEGRSDWVQHFIVSAALALAGDRRMADVIGVAKEADDITHSSGFSFTDLAADRTGTRLARAATASDASARRIQDALAGPIGEAAFFPHVGDLPESMSGDAFRRRFGDIRDDRYVRMVMEIDRRIDRIALYR